MKAMLKEGAGLSNGLLCTLAVIAGVSVANLYYNQPLLDMLRQDLGTTTLAANHVALFSQLGYALGLLFIIPLADLFSRRRIVLVNFLLLAVSLLAIATASDIRVIHGFSLVTVSGRRSPSRWRRRRFMPAATSSACSASAESRAL